jgi:hypothetical protein
MSMIRKGQGRRVSGTDIQRQIQFIHKLFEVLAGDLDFDSLSATASALPQLRGHRYARCRTA